VNEFAYSVFEIFTPSFFMGLEVFKEKSKKMNLKTRKHDLNLCFLTDFELFYYFGKLGKISFQKINRFID
jgi:hypothetical protein